MDDGEMGKDGVWRKENDAKQNWGSNPWMTAMGEAMETPQQLFIMAL